MFRILIAEDEEPIANLIRMNLTRAGYLCTWAPDGKSAADLMEQEKFDLALLDIMLPGINGYELMDYAKACELPVIFLTALGSTEDKVKGLRMGADDYLPKPFEPLELVLRIRNILKRAPQVREEVRDKLDLGLCVYDLNKKELHTKQGQIIHITPVEQALLGVLGQKSGQIFTREKLAELLGAGQSPRSIDVQITRLRKKIEKDSKNPRYLQTVRGVGYRLEDVDAETNL